jgi:hypothetical protein
VREDVNSPVSPSATDWLDIRQDGVIRFVDFRGQTGTGVFVGPTDFGPTPVVTVTELQPIEVWDSTLVPITIVGGHDIAPDSTDVIVSSRGQSLTTFLGTGLSRTLADGLSHAMAMKVDFESSPSQGHSLGGYTQVPEPSCLVLFAFAAFVIHVVRQFRLVK